MLLFRPTSSWLFFCRGGQGLLSGTGKREAIYGHFSQKNSPKGEPATETLPAVAKMILLAFSEVSRNWGPMIKEAETQEIFLPFRRGK